MQSKAAGGFLKRRNFSALLCDFFSHCLLSAQNLAEIQTYVNILQQINQTLPLVPNVSLGTSEVRSLMLSLCVHVLMCVCVCVRYVPKGEEGVCHRVSFGYVSGVDEVSGLSL